MKLYTFLRKILKNLILFLFRVEVENGERLQSEGAVLVCANHISNWDPIIMGAVFERPIRFMAKSSLFKIPLLSTLIKALGAFPVRRGEADTTALKTAIGNLRNNDAVGIFPQGKRYRGAEPKDTAVKTGVGMIVYRSGCDVLPVSIKTKKYKIALFRKVYIKVGETIKNCELKPESGNKSEYERVSGYVFEKILELL